MLKASELLQSCKCNCYIFYSISFFPKLTLLDITTNQEVGNTQRNVHSVKSKSAAAKRTTTTLVSGKPRSTLVYSGLTQILICMTFSVKSPKFNGKQRCEYR